MSLPRILYVVKPNWTNGRLMELDLKYVDVIIRRWQEWTGKQATHQADGLAFDDLDVLPTEADAVNNAH
jgi:hypothetical protein